MGGLIESLKANRRNFLIAGIHLQCQTEKDEIMYSRKELETKTIKELTEIHNKLVAKNERKATFRTQDKAIEAIEAAEKAASGASKAAPKGKGAAAADVKKAAGAAAGELEKSKRSANADNVVWKAIQGQFRFNEGSARALVYAELIANGKGMTLAQLQEALPKVKGISGCLNILKNRKQATASA